MDRLVQLKPTSGRVAQIVSQQGALSADVRRIQFRTAHLSRHHGFTLVELLVVMAVLSILASLLLPALQASLESARTTKCLSNMRQLGVLQSDYADSYRGLLPSAVYADLLADSGLIDHVENVSIVGGPHARLFCPSYSHFVYSAARKTKTYGMARRSGLHNNTDLGVNGTVCAGGRDQGSGASTWYIHTRLSKAIRPSISPLFFEYESQDHRVWIDSSNLYESMTMYPGKSQSFERHGERRNVMYADLHGQTHALEFFLPYQGAGSSLNFIARFYQ